MSFKREKIGNLENKKYAGAAKSLGNDDKILLNETGYGFYTGVVVDYFSEPERMINKQMDSDDPSSYTYKQFYNQTLENRVVVDSIPKNSIVAYILDDAISKATGKNFLCFPFFPSHMCLPIKPGEHVWIFAEKDRGHEVFYWVCRKTAPSQIEDINHTFLDRFSKSGDIFEKNKKVKKDRITTDLYSCHENYANEMYPDNITLTDIINSSFAIQNQFTTEPVPFVDKKCGDLLFQGSNNAYIHLTTEKFTSTADCYNLYDESYMINPTNDIGEFNRIPMSPAIDISIAAFKNDLIDIDSQIDQKSQENVLETDNLTIAKNSVGFYEINKAKNNIETADQTNKKFYGEYGKLDTPLNCGGRIYMSNNCKIDDIFLINKGDLSINQGSSLLLNSDYVRLLSNKNFKIVTGDVINSEIENLAYIEIKGGETEDNETKNGNIVIKPFDEKHIYLGSYDAEEPGVLGNTLADILDRLITSLLDTVITTPAGPAGPMRTSTLGTNISSIQSELENIKSLFVKIK